MSVSAAFAAIGGGCGLGSALLGVAGPLAAPFFLVKGFIGSAYIGTEAASSLIIPVTKIVTYGAGGLLSVHVLQLGLALTPAIVAGAWLGRGTLARMNAQAPRAGHRGWNSRRGDPVARRDLSRNSSWRCGVRSDRRALSALF
ncbi:hypothetical protein [Nonomuraea dietziae]|uniref:hypothetical protein n=1 Tax=Nonomuraea dietziae TaxID=65515 RepID=UPI0033F24952